jgi:hypothetical protein
VVQQVVGLTWLKRVQGLEGCYMQGSSVGATSRQQQRIHTEGLGAAAYMHRGWQRRWCDGGVQEGDQGSTRQARICEWVSMSSFQTATRQSS